MKKAAIVGGSMAAGGIMEGADEPAVVTGGLAEAGGTGLRREDMVGGSELAAGGGGSVSVGGGKGGCTSSAEGELTGGGGGGALDTGGRGGAVTGGRGGVASVYVDGREGGGAVPYTGAV